MSTQTTIARLIDHALLHPTLTDEAIREGCELAASLNLKSVCVKPYAVPLARRILAGTQTLVGTVIGFPHGAHTSPIKAAEADQACLDGADELDMVINVAKALQNDWEFVHDDIAAVVHAAQSHQALVKVILETDYLADDQLKRTLCQICMDAGANFVKTSTGFGFVKSDGGGYSYTGATESDVRLMKAVCNNHIGVKASGGIRSHADALRMIDAGATRLGTSASQAILSQAGRDESSY